MMDKRLADTRYYICSNCQKKIYPADGPYELFACSDNHFYCRDCFLAKIKKETDTVTVDEEGKKHYAPWVQKAADKLEKHYKAQVQHDAVNHPSHYNQSGLECIDAIAAATIGKTGIEAVCVGNIVKYLWRYEDKNGLEDVKKAQWYIDRLIAEVEQDTVPFEPTPEELKEDGL